MDDFFARVNNAIPENALIIHNVLNNKGFDTYFVGGALRDLFMQEHMDIDTTVKDWDLVTTARHEDIKKIFSKNLRVNSKKGIVTKKGRVELLIPEIETSYVILDGDGFEVTPMNTRLSGDAIFTLDVFEDLYSRDFTINMMAYSPKLGLISDFKYNGVDIDILNDIKNGVIKTSGNPEDSFSMDSSRMLRAIAFANRFNFGIDEATFEGLRENIFDINNINKSKILIVVKKLLSYKVTDGSRYIKELGVFQALNVNFNNKLTDRFLELWIEHDSVNDFKNIDSKIKYIYDNFEDKDNLLILYREFGMSKDNILSLIDGL